MLKTKKIFTVFFFIISIVTLGVLFQNSLKADNFSDKMNYVTAGTMQKIVWREDVYDASVNGNVSVIKLDENYFSGITEPERAVLGYLASTIGNECFAETGKQNVKCKILSALKLGYQCSEENKSFLKSWFRDDASMISRIENCKPTIPSTIEKTFEEVKISTEDNTIKVELKGLKLNIKENSASTWRESLSFKIDGDKISLIERTKKQK
jgi:hypothetical protein